ncbi:PE family protein [Nocardia spumae]|uniref:PE family protein n=1 Tax=Nocardia spumae TaxID=2887190 RepID=UPI001D15A689|nr:PE family protein [Nocardia spumae]
MYLQFSPEVIAAVYSTNTTVATTLSGLMQAAAGASTPAPQSADPVSAAVSAAFTSYHGGFYNITNNGISKFHEGNGKLPESIQRYEFGDSAGGARVKSADPGIAYV